MTVALQDQIKTLLDLQKLDLQIYQLNEKIAEYPGIRKEAEELFERKKQSFNAASDALKTLQLQQKEKEGGLQAAEEKVVKLQAQLYQIKTNKEYTAMEIEIKGLGADKSLLEEEILKLFDEVEQAKSRVAQEKEKLQVNEKEMKERMASIDREEAEQKAQVHQLEEERKAFLPKADAKILTQYEKLLKAREGLAIVSVETKNGSCGGCNLELPPQVVNEIQLGEKFILCESCSRILYWKS